MTQSDFVNWKRHPVTQEIFSQLEARIKFLQESIVEQCATQDQRTLAKMAGIAEGLEFLSNVDFEE